MLKKLSGLPDERLSYYLSRIREISAHAEIAALIETDKLIWELAFKEDAFEWTEDEEDFGPFGVDSTPNLHKFHEHQTIQANAHDVQVWTILTSRFETVEADLAEQLLQARNGKMSFDGYSGPYSRMRGWPERMREAIRHQAKQHSKNELDTWAATADRIESLLKEFEPIRLNDAIDRASKEYPRNIVGIESLLLSLTHRVDRFTQKCGDLPPNISQRIREVKIRLVQIRAQKKMDAAEVAWKGGRLRKSESDYREALGLLENDWKLGFPDETEPSGYLADQLHNLLSSRFNKQ